MIDISSDDLRTAAQACRDLADELDGIPTSRGRVGRLRVVAKRLDHAAFDMEDKGNG